MSTRATVLFTNIVERPEEFSPCRLAWLPVVIKRRLNPDLFPHSVLIEVPGYAGQGYINRNGKGLVHCYLWQRQPGESRFWMWVGENDVVWTAEREHD